MAVTLQIQSVIYNNEIPALMRAYESLANAVRVNRRTTKELGNVVLCCGDASKEPVLTERELAQISERFSDAFDFRYVFFHENTGHGKGQNILSRDCTSEYMMITNPDVIVCPRFFSGMLSPLLDKKLNIGMTEARQTPSEHPKEYDRETLLTEWAAMACVIFPTELFRRIGQFDSDCFFLYCDDVDFSWRLRLAGKQIMYRPDCPVYHAKRLSSTANWQPTSAEVYYSQEAALLIAYKYSNTERFKELYKRFKSANTAVGDKIIARFEEMKEKGILPQQLDPHHKVARFVGEGYSDSKYVL